MNKALIAAAVFLASFTASLWLFMPYQAFIDRIISNTQKNTGMTFKAQEVSERMFSTEYFGVTIDGREIGDISFGHNPLMLIRKKTTVRSKGIFNADAVVSTDSVKFTLETSGQALDFIREPIRMEGRVRLEGFLSAGKEKSKVFAGMEKAVMPSPLGDIEFENVTAVVEADGSVLNIISLKADGKTELDMQGRITLNKKNPASSEIDLHGYAGMLGFRKKLTVKGRMDNLHPIFD
ncbi:MAG: hypothetical protein AB7E96_07115 [Deferribacterales bacterium]